GQGRKAFYHKMHETHEKQTVRFRKSPSAGGRGIRAGRPPSATRPNGTAETSVLAEKHCQSALF
ncbi:MAG: hypothetical protein FWB93_05755, partial [Oscillospiraceae bacterium]|nr:hypothetical protein [Oscillospiraceae bacterium]